MSFDLVIFDCDGVLVDSEPIANRIWSDLISSLGYPITVEQAIEAFAGRTREDNLRLIERWLARPTPADFGKQYEARLFAELERDLKPVPGIEAALDQILIPMCIASSASHAKINLSLSLTGLLSRFEGRIFSGADVPRGKPHPDLFIKAAKGIGVSPTACVVVEDSIPGVQAGIAAGMTVLGFARLTNRQALISAGAHPFDDMCELPSLL